MNLETMWKQPIAVVFLVVVIRSNAHGVVLTDPTSKEPTVCMSKECIEVSHRMFRNMNLDADPCQDFNEFACGNFIKETVIPDDQGYTFGAFHPLISLLDNRGKILLEMENGDDKDAFETDNMARAYYKACTDEKEIERVGAKPMLEALHKIGGWPVHDGAKWNSRGRKWFDITYDCNELGLGIEYIIKLSIAADKKNISWRVVHLDQPSLGMPREYLIKGFDDKEVQLYYQYMVGVAELLGASSCDAEKEMRESLLFEISLANLSAPREERRNETKLYNPTTVGDFEQLPGYPPTMKEYLNTLSGNRGPKIEADEKLILKDPEFIRNLSKLLVDTDIRTIANYIGWRVLRSKISFLHKDARNLQEEYDRDLKEVERSQTTWKRCVRSVGFNPTSRHSLYPAASSMYVRKYFNSDDKMEVEKMIDYLRTAFGTILDDLDWMDDVTREKARLKLEKMGQYIAYPDEVMVKQEMEQFFKGLEVSSLTHFENGLEISKFWRGKEWRKLHEKIDPKHWTEHLVVAAVNAFYSPDINGMKFPAGILQGAFFNSKAPKFMNFGSIGSVIGHEITHGFDDRGRMQDHEGSLADWWNAETTEKFKSRAKCIIDQYSSYNATQVGINLNGVNTQGENIADNGGVKEAYLAYKNWSLGNGPDPILAGHNFNQMQLFWISYGQLWCAKYKDGTLKSHILTGYHSTGEFRIKGPLSNNRDFARDFNCPCRSPMNPIDKCAVW